MGYNSKKMAVSLLLLLCLSAGRARAQSIGQLLEQLTLDVQKLSELRTILKEMYTGYEVVDKGYTAVRDVVRDNFNLHKAFLDGLLAVSPAVRQYYRVASIMDMERSMISEYQSAERSWAGNGVFTSEELQYIHGVYASLSGRAGKYLDRLSMVLTGQQLRMSDAERMQSIDGIYVEVASDLRGLRLYNDELSIQAMQREKELRNINLLKSMYGEQP